MSYEGHVQYWCKKGHYFEGPETYGNYADVCSICGAPVAFRNMVDDTNEYGEGAVIPVPIYEGSEGNVEAKTEVNDKGMYVTTTVTVHGVYKIPERRR